MSLRDVSDLLAGLSRAPLSSRRAARVPPRDGPQPHLYSRPDAGDPCRPCGRLVRIAARRRAGTLRDRRVEDQAPDNRPIRPNRARWTKASTGADRRFDTNGQGPRSTAPPGEAQAQGEDTQEPAGIGSL